MKRDYYQVQELAGYADGRPSWRKSNVPASSTWSREAAEKAMAELQERHPDRTLRIRKVKR